MVECDFAIMGMQRTGTTVLTAALNTNPAIFAAREIFHPDAIEHESFSKFVSNTPEAIHAGVGTQYSAFIESLRASSGKPIIGVNIKYSSCHKLNGDWKNLTDPPDLFEIFRQRNTKIIHVVRDNMLQVAVSSLVARATDVWHRDANSTSTYAPVEINPTSVIALIKTYEREHAKFIQYTQNFNSVLTIYYDLMFENGAFSQHTLDQVSAFIGIENLFNSIPLLAKIVPEDLTKAVSNWSDVSRKVRDAGYGHFLPAVEMGVMSDPTSATRDSAPNDDDRRLLADALLDTYFAHTDPAYRETDSFKRDLWDHVEARYAHFKNDVVPWIKRHVDISEHQIVEIGAGTGSSTAAIAPFVKSVMSFDVNVISTEASRRRAEILGIGNIVQNLSYFTDDALPASQLIDGVFLAAVLEHCTFEECHKLLKAAWNRLKPGGWMCVVDTPNRFGPIDHHTSFLPFFSSLPIEIKIAYAPRSKRENFSAHFSGKYKDDETLMDMTRWGSGISYHEFELAISPEFSRYIIADGWEPEINAAINILPEDIYVELALKTFAPEVSRAFARRTFYFIARKPLGD